MKKFESMESYEASRSVERAAWLFRLYQAATVLVFFLLMLSDSTNWIFYDAVSFYIVPGFLIAFYVTFAAERLVCRRKNLRAAFVSTVVHTFVVVILLVSMLMAAFAMAFEAYHGDTPILHWNAVLTLVFLIAGLMYSWGVSLTIVRDCSYLRACRHRQGGHMADVPDRFEIVGGGQGA